MKYLILGTGLQGRIVGYDILNYEKDAEVIFTDIGQENLDIAKEIIKDKRASYRILDVIDEEETVKAMKAVDAVVVCVPHGEETDAAYRALIKTGNLRVVFSDFWQWERHHSYADGLKKAGVLCVPGMGIAPGFANICIGQLAHEFEELHEGIMYVGGIPAEKGVCPTDYMQSFNMEAMLDMYVTPSKVIEDGKIVEKPNLKVFDTILIPGHGEAEVFWTDGLCTLEKTMMGKVNKLAECTLRWPGHIAKMKELEELGFFSTEEIEVKGVMMRPLDMAEAVLGKLWKKVPGIRDMTYLRVVGKGLKDGILTEKTYELKTYSDEETGITSMELATAYPISIAAMMVAHDTSGRIGMIDPEEYFLGDTFKELVDHLAERGVYVYES